MEQPADHQLLAYLDGELPPEARAAIDAQLAASWELRARLAELSRDVEFFVRETAPRLPEPPPAQEVWGTLESRLKQTPSSAAGPSLVRPLVTLGAIAAAITAAVFLLRPPMANPSLATADVLDRARRAESVESDVLLRPVVHRRMRIRHSGPRRPAVESAVWDVWRASRPTRIRQHTEGSAPLVGSLRAVLTRNGMDPDRPLSAAVYSDWTRTRGAASAATLRQTSLPDGREAVVVSAHVHASSNDSIVAASLTLQTSDWRPVSQELTIETQTGREQYTIDEVDYHLLSATSIPPDFFEPAQAAATGPQVEPVQLPEPTPAAAIPSPTPLPPAPADLLRTALAAQLTLHRTALCARPSIEIVRRLPDAVLLRGALPDADQTTLLEALSGLTLLQPELQPGAPDNRSTDLSQRIAGHQQLAAGRSLSLVSLLRAVTDDAGALHRHVSGYSTVEIASASPALQIHLRQILEEHLTALRANLAQAANLLSATDPPAGSTSPPPASDWHTALLNLTAGVDRVNTLAADGLLPRQQLAAQCLQLANQAAQVSALLASAAQ